MNYGQRQIYNRIIFWIQLLVIVVCGLYIFYVALSSETSLFSAATSDMYETYLMGRWTSQVSSHTTYSVFPFSLCYQTLLLCQEDRALQQCNPSAWQPVSTCSGQLVFPGPEAGWPDPAF